MVGPAQFPTNPLLPHHLWTHASKRPTLAQRIPSPTYPAITSAAGTPQQWVVLAGALILPSLAMKNMLPMLASIVKQATELSLISAVRSTLLTRCQFFISTEIAHKK